MPNILEIKNLFVEYKLSLPFSSDYDIVHAVNDVNLFVREGEILSIAGESGCGKSTLAKAILNLIDVKSGSILFCSDNVTNIKKYTDLKKYYQNMQIVFQNPFSSLNPKMAVYDILKEPLKINTNLSKKEIDQRIREKLDAVGLTEDVLKLYPHEFSGGQRQRIAIARALVLNPKFIVADEPVSALDVSIQAQIINLIKELRLNFGLTFIFISHDLSVIRYISDRVAIMYLGEIIESGTTHEIFNNPKHPYTKALLSSIPKMESSCESGQCTLSGDLPSAVNLPNGCKFHTRCGCAIDKCVKCIPEDIQFSQDHSCKCFLYESVI